MGLNILLLAPTGRAAKRLGELCQREAQTIHRCLGMVWREETGELTFQKNEKEPLEAEAVIVDEMSMVDLPLMAALPGGAEARLPAGDGGGPGPAALGGAGERVLRPDPLRADRDRGPDGDLPPGPGERHHPGGPTR